MTEPNMGRENSEMDEDDTEVNAPTVTLTDESGRSLSCYVEHSLEVEDQEYILLSPVDSPIVIFAWEAEDEEEEATLVDIEDSEVDEVFATARAVLAEQDLTLNRAALTLTASGDLPVATEDDLFTLDLEDEDPELEPEQFQLLAHFYHEEQEYAICTPLDPLLFFAKMNNQGQPELLSPDEYMEIRSQLEDQLFDDLE